ncbi:group II intron maturase-specific domain-containing protein [Streptomyces sp. NPDC001275]
MWSWRLHRHTSLSEQDLALWLNPIVSGWMNYYGRFYRSELYPLLRRINVDSSHNGSGFRSSERDREEPGDGRLSRRDLWEPGGESPPGHPTTSTHNRGRLVRLAPARRVHAPSRRSFR